MYASYEYYITVWAGIEIPAQDFTRLANKVGRQIDYLTTNRVNLLPTVPAEVKNAVCAAVEELYQLQQSVKNNPAGIKSESNDGVSVTYQDSSINNIIKQEQIIMNRAIRQDLADTGLLYRGC